MSLDLETRRLVRDLLRAGNSVEEVFDVVVAELLKGGLRRHVRVEQTLYETTVTFTHRRGSDPGPAAVVPGSEAVHEGPPILVNGEDVEDDLGPSPERLRDAPYHPLANPGGANPDEFGGSDYP